MNLTLSPKPREGRCWPSYILWGRLRTSTAALLIAFIGVWWLYETYQPPQQPPEAPATQVVPPGFIPDPSYTWVPRTDVQRRTTTTTPETTTETPPPTSPTEPTSPEAIPPSPTSPTTEPAPAPGASPTPPSPSPATTQSPSPSPSPAPGQGPMVAPGLPS